MTTLENLIATMADALTQWMPNTPPEHWRMDGWCTFCNPHHPGTGLAHSLAAALEGKVISVDRLEDALTDAFYEFGGGDPDEPEDAVLCESFMKLARARLREVPPNE